jgi:glucose-1-phosphate thymidylyltransferase
LILGNNLLFGGNVLQCIARAKARPCGATIVACRCRNPQQYGVVELGSAGRPVSIEEKPQGLRSDWAVTGLCFYDNRIVHYVENLNPSARGELEITDVSNAYLKRGNWSQNG